MKRKSIKPSDAIDDISNKPRVAALQEQARQGLELSNRDFQFAVMQMMGEKDKAEKAEVMKARVKVAKLEAEVKRMSGDIEQLKHGLLHKK